MSLLQEAAIFTGDTWRGVFCLVNNLVNPNKARIETIVTYGESTMHATSEDGSYKAVLRGERIPEGPTPAALLAAQLQQAVIAHYETPKQVEWRIVFDSQQSVK